MSGTTAYKGRSATMQISANGGSTFTTIGGVRTTSLKINNNPVDITNVSSGGFREVLADGGTQQFDIDVDGILVDDTAWEALEAVVDDRTLVWFKLSFGNAGVVTSKFAASAFSIGAPHDGAQTFTCSLMSSGTVTFTPTT